MSTPPISPIYSNLFTVTVHPTIMNVVFLHQTDAKAPNIEVGHMVMTIDNARELGKLMVQMADDAAAKAAGAVITKPIAH